MRASKLGIITIIPNSPQGLQCAKWLKLHFATESASQLALWDKYNIRCLPVLLTYRHSQEVASIRVLILDSRWGTKPFKNDVVVQDQSWAVSQGLIPNPLTPNLPTTQHCLANFWGGQSQVLPFRRRKFKFRRSKTASGSIMLGGFWKGFAFQIKLQLCHCYPVLLPFSSFKCRHDAWCYSSHLVTMRTQAPWNRRTKGASFILSSLKVPQSPYLQTSYYSIKF